MRGRSGSLAVSLVAALTLVGFLSPPDAAAATGGKDQVALGAYIPRSAWQPGEIDRYSRLVGRRPVIVSIYKSWDSQPFDQTELDGVWSRGAVPMISWEPLSYQSREFPLGAIQRGHFDDYVRESARAARDWGRPILLRFAHEMNGDWYPWGRGVGDNNSYRYRAVWRRLVGIFRTQGADNVQWVWAPNVNTGGDFPFLDLYPGDQWVDWVGFDGYNWAKAGEWNSFTDVFDNSYEELTQHTSRPMIITETGSSESGGDKAAWVSSALDREIPGFARIRAVVWFEDEFKGLDARADSSSDSLEAFRASIASPQWGLSRAELLATPASYGGGSTAAPPAPGDGFGEPSFLYRITHKLQGRYLWIAVGMAAALLVLLALASLFVRRILRARPAE